MNTRLRLTTLFAVFASLTPAGSILHAQAPAATDGIDVPDGTRKCIKPKERALKPIDLFAPLTCLEPVVNVSATTGNQAESFVNVNPTNTNNLVGTSNDPGTSERSLVRRASLAVAVFEQKFCEQGKGENERACRLTRFGLFRVAGQF